MLSVNYPPAGHAWELSTLLPCLRSTESEAAQGAYWPRLWMRMPTAATASTAPAMATSADVEIPRREFPFIFRGCLG